MRYRKMHAIVLVIFSFLMVLPAESDDFVCYRSPDKTQPTLKEAVKQEILLRLGLHEEPSNPNATEIDTADEEYDFLKENQKLSEVHTPCANLDFKETIQFDPTVVERRRPLANIANGDDCPSKLKFKRK